MKLIVDGHEIPVQTLVVVINEGLTGPVDGLTNDELHTVFTPDNVIVQEIRTLNTATTTGAKTSHRNTTAQTIATAANTPG